MLPTALAAIPPALRRTSISFFRPSDRRLLPPAVTTVTPLAALPRGLAVNPQPFSVLILFSPPDELPTACLRDSLRGVATVAQRSWLCFLPLSLHGSYTGGCRLRQSLRQCQCSPGRAATVTNRDQWKKAGSLPGRRAEVTHPSHLHRSVLSASYRHSRLVSACRLHDQLFPPHRSRAGVERISRNC